MRSTPKQRKCKGKEGGFYVLAVVAVCHGRHKKRWIGSGWSARIARVGRALTDKLCRNARSKTIPSRFQKMDYVCLKQKTSLKTEHNPTFFYNLYLNITTIGQPFPRLSS